MERLTSFILIGPLFAWLVFLAMLTPDLLTRPRFENGLQFFVLALVVCYVGGIPFLLALAGIDRLMSRHRWRALPLAVIGFAIAFGLFYGLSRGGVERDFNRYWLGLGLMGAVPAAICSWLARRAVTPR